MENHNLLEEHQTRDIIVHIKIQEITRTKQPGTTICNNGKALGEDLSSTDITQMTDVWKTLEDMIITYHNISNNYKDLAVAIAEGNMPQRETKEDIDPMLEHHRDQLMKQTYESSRITKEVIPLIRKNPHGVPDQ